MSPAPVLVKICGLTSASEARAVAEVGADWIGLNFHPPSPRFVSEGTARSIIGALPGTTQAVGLFVNRPPEEVCAVAQRVGLAIVQLHGEEPFTYVRQLHEVGGLFVLRAFRLGNTDDIVRMTAWLMAADDDGGMPDAVLVDAQVSGQWGGTGHIVPVEILERLPTFDPPSLADRFLAPLEMRPPQWILAGGLNPENVAERVRRFRPWMVDVASGVESTPGHKDLDRVAAFIRAARSV